MLGNCNRSYLLYMYCKIIHNVRLSFLDGINGMKNNKQPISLAEAVYLARKFGSINIATGNVVVSSDISQKFQPAKKVSPNEKLKQLENVGFAVTN